MSKFINKETVEYVKVKQSSTTAQQLSLLKDQVVMLQAKAERDAFNYSDLISHLGVNLQQTQDIFDQKKQELEDRITDVTLGTKYQREVLERFVKVSIGVIAVWLTTLSILILIKG